MILIILCLVQFVASKDCYWNKQCPNVHYSTKTSYDSLRGDIRDYTDPEFCEAVSIWSLLRHGNRNPATEYSIPMKTLLDKIQGQIVIAFEGQRSQLCAQDVEELRNWIFNETPLASPLRLTSVGYREIYDIARRVRTRYPHLLLGETTDYYFKSTQRHWATASALAYIQGLTDKTNLSLTIDRSEEKNHVVEPIKYCQRYEPGLNGRFSILEETEARAHEESDEYLAVQRAVQARLGIEYQLNATEIYTLYDICRYHRTWSRNHQDAWCAIFSDQDLEVLGYRDDIRHYYRNGYGCWLSPRLAGPLLQDLRERFREAVRGQGKKIISYFAHNSMTLQTFVALGLFRDKVPPTGAKRNPDRLWRSSRIAAFATNMMVVLNRCIDHANWTYRVQVFINEKPTELCPLPGCTWERFEELVKDFEDSLDFCRPDYPVPVLNVNTSIHEKPLHPKHYGVRTQKADYIEPH